MTEPDSIAITPARDSLTANKVPEVTVSFWAVKLLTTGMGETTSDTLVHRFDPVFAVAAAGVIFMAVLGSQFWLNGFDRWRYWAAVTMVSVFGTMAADVIHIGLGVPYAVSTAAFAIALVGIFATWKAVEGTLSIHAIDTPRREAFYWAAVLATFALGTAAGDMTATTFGLGYFASGVLFLAAFAVPGLWFWLTHRNPIASFWIAYVLTRPVGASFGDWVGVSHERGGLAWGTGAVSLVLFVAIMALVAVGPRLAARPIGGLAPSAD